MNNSVKVLVQLFLSLDNGILAVRRFVCERHSTELWDGQSERQSTQQEEAFEDADESHHYGHRLRLWQTISERPPSHARKSTPAVRPPRAARRAVVSAPTAAWSVAGAGAPGRRPRDSALEPASTSNHAGRLLARSAAADAALRRRRLAVFVYECTAVHRAVSVYGRYMAITVISLTVLVLLASRLGRPVGANAACTLHHGCTSLARRLARLSDRSDSRATGAWQARGRGQPCCRAQDTQQASGLGRASGGVAVRHG